MTNQLQKQFRILLLGDSCYDYYHYGTVNRISPEAPIPIFDHKYTRKKLGMMSNVLENFNALGIYPDYQTHFFESKNRYLDIKSKQQLLRVDQKIFEDGIRDIIHSTIDYKKYDAIVISDYAKGFFDYEDYVKIRSCFSGLIFIDTKDKLLSRYKDAIVKVNEYEYKQSELYDKNPNQHLIVTQGAHSVTWHKPHPDASSVFYPPEVATYDVCGAGDTFFAAFVFEHLRTSGDIACAIRFAMKAASITVQKIGVYAPSLAEIES